MSASFQTYEASMRRVIIWSHDADHIENIHDVDEDTIVPSIEWACSTPGSPDDNDSDKWWSSSAASSDDNDDDEDEEEEETSSSSDDDDDATDSFSLDEDCCARLVAFQAWLEEKLVLFEARLERIRLEREEREREMEELVAKEEGEKGYEADAEDSV